MLAVGVLFLFTAGAMGTKAEENAPVDDALVKIGLQLQAIRMDLEKMKAVLKEQDDPEPPEKPGSKE